MAKKQFGLSYSKCMISVKEDNQIILIENDREGNEYYFNLTEELKGLQKESNVNIKISFDNELDWD